MGMAFKSADELNAERLADRYVHLNSNGFVLGTSSAGKSFKVKFELAHWFLNQFDVEPIVIDPDMSDGGVGSSAVKPNNSVIAFGGRFDRTAQQILDSARDAEGGGAMV